MEILKDAIATASAHETATLVILNILGWGLFLYLNLSGKLV